MTDRRDPVLLAAAGVIIAAMAILVPFTVENTYATFWALVPPVVAIGLALITKEVFPPCSSASWWAACSPAAARRPPPSTTWSPPA